MSANLVTDLPQPSIAEFAAILEALPVQAITRRLLTDQNALTRATIADARGKAGPHLRAALRRPEALESWQRALAATAADTTASASRERAGNNRHSARYRRLVALRGRLDSRRAEAATLARRRDAEFLDAYDLAFGDLRHAHRAEFDSRLRDELDALGLSQQRTYSTPATRHAWARLVEWGLVDYTDSEKSLLSIDDADFSALVVADAKGNVVEGLRHPGVIDRWITALVAAVDADRSLRAPAQPGRALRRARYRDALNARQGEARRAAVRRQDAVRAMLDAANQEPARQAAAASAGEALIAAHESEFAALLDARNCATADDSVA